MGAKSKPQETLGSADVGGVTAAQTTVLALSAPPARGDRRRLEDGASRARGDRRVPRREAAALKTLVFLEHHDGARHEAVAGACSRGPRGSAARRAGSSPARVCGAPRRLPAASARSVDLRRRRRAPRGAAARSRASTCSRRSSATKGSTRCCSRSRCSPRTSPPGLAVRLGAGLNWDLVDLEEDGETLVGKRPGARRLGLGRRGVGGRLRGSALFRAGSFDPAETGGVGRGARRSR